MVWENTTSPLAWSDTSDLPGQPDRIDKAGQRTTALIERIHQGAITLPEVFEHSLKTLGRFKISAKGIDIDGKLDIRTREMASIFESMSHAIVLMHQLLGKDIFIKIRGVQTYKMHIGLPPVITPVKQGKIRVPMLELDLDMISYLSMGTEGFILLSTEDLWKIHGFEVLAGWLGDNWQEGMTFVDLVIPLCKFITRENMGYLGQPLTACWEEVLTKCGV